MHKITSILTLLLITACATSSGVKPQEINSKLEYTRAFQRLLDGVQHCYYAHAIQSDLHMDRQKGEISFGSQDADNVQLTVRGLSDKTSTVTISDPSFTPQIASWLKNKQDCGR